MADNIIEALFNVQQKGLKPVKGGTNPHFKSKYVTLDSLLEVVIPALAEEDVLLLQTLCDIEGTPAINTALVHVPSQNTLEARTPMVFAKADPQGVGSAITYYRRYALMALLGLVGEEDDDGNKASSPAPKISRKLARGASAAKAEAVAPGADDSFGGGLF